MTGYNTNDSDRELERLVHKDKASISADFQNNYIIQEQTLEQLVLGLRHSEHNGFNDNKLIWNIAGNLNIISYDLKIIIHDMTFAQGEWQKRHYARQASLLIYESVDDLFVLLGRDFKELTKNRLDITDLQDDLKSIKQDLNTFKATYSDNLQTIRNIAIAHRDNDVLKQIEIIQQINWGQCVKMTMEFEAILQKLGKFLTALIKKGLTDLSELKATKK